MITSLTNKTIKELIKLKQKKNRQNEYLIEGFHIVEMAIEKDVVELIITTDKHLKGENVILVSEEVMAKLAFTPSPQPIMAKCKMIETTPNYNLERSLILDNVQDPGNVGTLIRSAIALGYEAVFLSHGSVDIYNDKVMRSMQGAHFNIPIHYIEIRECIKQLQSNGVEVIATALENGQDISNFSTSKNLAIVLGNEGSGMLQENIDLCDKIGYIPIQNIESLNVGVAGGIMMYHFKK